ncbi:hypothetical protein KQI52_13405 [bacterium]|nr:hypothetical protein [bacterium]
MRPSLFILLFLLFQAGLAFSSDKVSTSAPSSTLETTEILQIDLQLMRVERILWIEYYGVLDRLAKAIRISPSSISHIERIPHAFFIQSIHYDRQKDKIVGEIEMLPYAPYLSFMKQPKFERKDQITNVSQYVFAKITNELPWIQDNPNVLLLDYYAVDDDQQLMIATQHGQQLEFR